MPGLTAPDQATLQHWLEQAGVDHYLCNECSGLHFRELQDQEGVIDCRLFLEAYGLLLTTELEIRPMALLPIAADLGRLNMSYPSLKIFLDVVDDAVPQLVVAGTVLTGAGVTPEQVTNFLATNFEATRALVSECLHLDYLFEAPQPQGGQPSTALH